MFLSAIYYFLNMIKQYYLTNKTVRLFLKHSNNKNNNSKHKIYSNKVFAAIPFIFFISIKYVFIDWMRKWESREKQKFKISTTVLTKKFKKETLCKIEFPWIDLRINLK